MVADYIAHHYHNRHGYEWGAGSYLLYNGILGASASLSTTRQANARLGLCLSH
jgi:hypothetical protein